MVGVARRGYGVEELMTISAAGREL